MFLADLSGMNDYVNYILVSALLLFCSCALIKVVSLKILRPKQQRNFPNLIYGCCLLACGLGCFLYTTRFPDLPLSVLKNFDHSAIFLLIAGTCTPFAFRPIHGPLGKPLIYWIWGMALAGITLRLIMRNDFDQYFVMLYLAMGWIFFAAVKDIARHASSQSLVFLAVGALIYSIGAIIFSVGIGTWTDAIWHMFVLSAAIVHFIAVLSLPKKAALHENEIINFQTNVIT